MWDKIYKKNPDIVKRKIVDELILVPIGSSMGRQQKIFSLNGLGEYIYDHFDSIVSLEEILAGILKEFSVTKEQAQTDLLEFVAKMHEQGIILERN